MASIQNKASGHYIYSLADKLQELSKALSEEERTMLEHLLLAALTPHVREELWPSRDLLLGQEMELIDSLARFRG
jgi:hypothetical protein